MSRDLLTRTYTSASERQLKRPLLSSSLNAGHRTGTHPIEQLQHALGNRAVAGLIQSKRLAAETGLLIQPKLVVGAAGDHYEREADHVASRVMTMPKRTKKKRSKRNRWLSRLCPLSSAR
jgi:hypothetical protein